MADDNNTNFSSSSAAGGNHPGSAVVQNGAFVVAPNNLRKNIIRAGVVTGSTPVTPQSGAVVAMGSTVTGGGWFPTTSYFNQVDGVQGSEVNNVTVSGSSPDWGAHYYAGTVVVGQDGIVDGLNVDAANALAAVGVGGVVNQATAQAGGSIFDGKGAVINGATALGLGTITIGAGGVVNGGTASGASNLYPGLSAGIITVSGQNAVLNDGVAQAYGTVSALNSGIINNATAQNGGTVSAGNGGVVDGGTAAGGVLAAGAGGTLLAGDVNHNISGGTAISGGIISAQNGGTADNAVASGGGTIVAGNGGVVSNAIAVSATAGLGFAGSAGAMVVNSGGIISGATVQGGALATVSGGGTIVGGSVDSGGAIIETGSGAVVSNVTLNGTYHGIIPLPVIQSIFGGYSGGALLVSASGAVASDITVSGGAIAVAMVSGATILGGTAIGTQGPLDGHKRAGLIAAGADGAVVSGATALSRGIVAAGVAGATAGGTVYAGGTIEPMAAGAVISNATLYAGGTLYNSADNNSGIMAGATYNSITFESGQLLRASGGSMSNVTAYGGAAVGIFGSNNYITGATAYGSGGNGASVDALNGGTIYAGTAASGGIIAAGNASANGIPFQQGGSGISLLSDAHIMNGGLGIVGGNSNLTVTKHGTQVTLNGAGVSSDAVVDAGGILDINSRGTEIGGTIAGTALVESGGTLSGALFSGADEAGVHGAGSGYVDIGGTANGNNIVSGATLTFNGGVGTGNTAQAGGLIDVGGGGSWAVDPNNQGALVGSGTMYGTASQTVLSSGGIMSVRSGGTALGVDVHSNATIVVASGASVSGATIGAGEDKWAGDGGTVTDLSSGIAYVSAGGLLSGATLIGGSGAGSTVEQMGGLLRVEKGATVTGLTMGNFGQIEVTGVNYGAGESVTYINNSITLWSDGVFEWGATLSGGPYSSGGFQVWDDNGTATIVYDVCFLKGTLISTPNGDVEVQKLKEGDLVWAVENGQNTARSIRGLHRGKSAINRHLPTDLAGWSVCVRAGAFGNDLPKRDLRVTPEHCFFFEGKFIPVRMLVNGSSIYYDTSLADFEYFHFETEPHAIIRAEGVLTESWLNTKERRQVVNLSSGITRLERIPSRTWEKDAAAPLDVSPAFAERLWNNFQIRALKSGIQENFAKDLSFEDDPNLRLCLKNGREIKPANRRGNKYFFQIPAGIGQENLFLVSRVFRPSESIGPWIDDRRQLGVLVGKLTVAVGDCFREITAFSGVANAPGWDVVENIPCRWTKGKAILPILGTEEELRYGFSLIVEVLAGGPYPEQEEGQVQLVLSGASFG